MRIIKGLHLKLKRLSVSLTILNLGPNKEQNWDHLKHKKYLISSVFSIIYTHIYIIQIYIYIYIYI